MYINKPKREVFFEETNRIAIGDGGGFNYVSTGGRYRMELKSDYTVDLIKTKYRHLYNNKYNGNFVVIKHSKLFIFTHS